MGKRSRIVWAAACAGLIGVSCVWDVNGDGQIVIACLGDSNTWPWSGHCERLAAEHPELVFVNYGVPGSKSTIDAQNGLVQIERAAAGEKGPPADIVILAFGTNDIGPSGTITATEMADRVDTLKAAARAAGMPAFVATIPPRFVHGTCTPAVSQPVIDAANGLIRDRADPTWLVDFDTGFTCPTHFENDRVHVSDAGGQLRADRAETMIFYVPPQN